MVSLNIIVLTFTLSEIIVKVPSFRNCGDEGK